MQREIQRLLRIQSRRLLSQAGLAALLQILLLVAPARLAASLLLPREARRRLHL
jgi:hypothetical protein